MTQNGRRFHDSNPSLRQFAVGSALLLTTLLLVVPSAQAQTFTVLHRFTSQGDGKFPLAGVIRDSIGNLYGTSAHGGTFDYGTVFELDAKGKEAILHSFWGGDGLWPIATLLRDRRGNLYGTTINGGTSGGCRHGCGTVFKLDPAGKETVLYAFSGGADGGNPTVGLIRDREGNLYGVTSAGGDLTSCQPAGCGVAFKLDKNGNQTVLHTFTGTPDGWEPGGGLIQDRSGNLYGVTERGGGSNWGTVFKLDKSGKETILYSFTGGSNVQPVGALVQGAAGDFYGAADGYSYDCGLIFRLDKNGNETVLYTFKGQTDGCYPEGVVRDRAGRFYGATVQGGSTACGGFGCGTIFKVDTSGNETVLYAFTGGKDGSSPNGDLIMDKSGNLYGTAQWGGDSSCGGGGYGCGVVFKLSP